MAAASATGRETRQTDIATTEHLVAQCISAHINQRNTNTQVCECMRAYLVLEAVTLASRQNTDKDDVTVGDVH